MYMAEQFPVYVSVQAPDGFTFTISGMVWTVYNATISYLNAQQIWSRGAQVATGVQTGFDSSAQFVRAWIEFGPTLMGLTPGTYILSLVVSGLGSDELERIFEVDFRTTAQLDGSV